MSENPREAVARPIEAEIARLKLAIAEAIGPVPHLEAQLEEQERQLRYVRGLR